MQHHIILIFKPHMHLSGEALTIFPVSFFFFILMCVFHKNYVYVYLLNVKPHINTTYYFIVHFEIIIYFKLNLRCQYTYNHEFKYFQDHGHKKRDKLNAQC